MQGRPHCYDNIADSHLLKQNVGEHRFAITAEGSAYDPAILVCSTPKRIRAFREATSFVLYLTNVNVERSYTPILVSKPWNTQSMMLM